MLSRRLEAALREAPHPPTSRRLAADAEVGLLQGNGNHCDLVAGELRAAPSSAARVRAAYRTARVDVAILEEGGASLPEARPLRRLAELGLRAPRTGETRYLVWLSEQSEAGFDPRCH